ncbi:MAG: hypothetical protein ACRDZ8_05550 [Acidimicrobiales bacterium]
MDDQILPPYAEPTGPRNSDDTVLVEYAKGLYAGHSKRFHVEGPALLVDRIDVAALRIGPNTILVRIDLADDLQDAKPMVERALGDHGMTCVDEDTLLAAPIAIQVLGIRLSSWDLWGTDLVEAMASLRSAALGEEIRPAGR